MKRTLAALTLALAGCTSYVTEEKYNATRADLRRDLLEEIRNDPEVIAALNSGVDALNKRYADSERRTTDQLSGFEGQLNDYQDESGRAARSAETATRSAEALRGTVETQLGDFRGEYGPKIEEVNQRATGVIGRVEAMEESHDEANRTYEERFLPVHEQREQILRSLDEALRTARTPEEIRRAIDAARNAGQ